MLKGITKRCGYWRDAYVMLCGFCSLGTRHFGNNLASCISTCYTTTVPVLEAIDTQVEF